MNPFDLPGPQFLALYAMLGIVVVGALYYFKQQAEAGEPGRLPVSDPYVIAYLRGGAAEAVRLGVAVLVDRKLLAIGRGDTVSLREGVTPMHGSNDLERAILEQCTTEQHPRDLAVSHRLQEVARRSYEPMLRQMNLLAGPEVRGAPGANVAIAIVVLVVVAAIKLAIGLSRNRPVSFLVISAVVFVVLTMVVTRGRRTVRGDRMLGDLTSLFDALRERAGELRPYTSTSELALLMAVFGFNAVPEMAFPFAACLQAGATTASSCGSSRIRVAGSSSGSSCGGGGSSCGGGGGGCGGCGVRETVRLKADTTDRFGLTWQPALAAGILANLDRIDVVEVIAEEQFAASSRAARALETLAHQVPLLVHGVALGPASTASVDSRRLDKLARLVDRVKPAFWSEHLASVRAGDIEIGHLAAAPRTKATIDATASNLARAASVVGSRPMVENIATLMEPPASDCSEAEWVSSVVAGSDCDLLLDLHNVHANSVNFGFDPIAYLDRLDPERIGAIHLAGGCWIEGRLIGRLKADPT